MRIFNFQLLHGHGIGQVSNSFPFFILEEMLVVEELYNEAVVGTERKLIIFNGELDRIRSGCILFFFFSVKSKKANYSKPPQHLN